MDFFRWFARHYIFVGLVFLLILIPFIFPSEWIVATREFIEKAGFLQGLFFLGIVLFVSTVIAPLNTFSLVPFASMVFGWKITAFVCVIAWTLGAVVAFIFSRHYGKRALSFLKILQETEKYSNRVPEDLSFLSLIFLRMLIPVDILSYAIGLFTNISLFRYTLATAIGVTPFSIIWSYGGEAALSKQYLSLFSAGAVAVLVVLIGRHFYKINKN